MDPVEIAPRQHWWYLVLFRPVPAEILLIRFSRLSPLGRGKQLVRVEGVDHAAEVVTQAVRPGHRESRAVQDRQNEDLQGGVCVTRVPHLEETTPPQNPTVGLDLRPCGSRRG